MGDFRGLTQKLDYLQDLGITAIWLLPFYPSPWRDDGYDIADYADIHPAYGTMADFKRFMREAHSAACASSPSWSSTTRRTSTRGSSGAARQAGLAARDFYVWTDDPNEVPRARIIFKDFESSNWSWDPVAQQYYWHRFYSHQPDLNFDNPAVHDALLKLMDFWFNWASTACGWTPSRTCTSARARTARTCRRRTVPEEDAAHLDANHRNRMFLAEANQWPEETVPYFGDGDECHMAFHFPVMPRLFMSIQMEDRFPIIDILKQTPAIPENCQWATFLRNHDELTLEMVTDEERDYMYRMYASDPQARINLGIRRRLAPLLGNNRRKIELMNSLLFSLPGTPCCTTATRSAWATTSTWATATACARRCSGAPTATPASRGQPAAAVPAGHRRPGVPLRDGQRRGAAGEPELAAVVDEAADRAAQAVPGVRPRHHRVPVSRQPQGAGVPALLRGRDRPGRREPVALRAVRAARPVAVPGPRARRAVRPDGVPADRRRPVLRDARAARVLLVPDRRPRPAGIARIARAAGRRCCATATPRRSRRCCRDYITASAGSRARAARSAACQGEGRPAWRCRTRNHRIAAGRRAVRRGGRPRRTCCRSRCSRVWTRSSCSTSTPARSSRRSSGDGWRAVLWTRTPSRSGVPGRAARRHTRPPHMKGRQASCRERRRASCAGCRVSLDDRQSRLLGAEQSNTSLVFGRDIVVKLYRRLEDGSASTSRSASSW
jgi:hypothetical protein